MVKEKGNYKYRSPFTVAEVGMVLQGSAPLWGTIGGDRADMFLVQESLCCEAWVSVDREFIKDLPLATAAEAHPISGLFAQLSSCVSLNCYCILNFGLCLRLAYLPPS